MSNHRAQGTGVDSAPVRWLGDQLASPKRVQSRRRLSEPDGRSTEVSDAGLESVGYRRSQRRAHHQLRHHVSMPNGEQQPQASEVIDDVSTMPAISAPASESSGKVASAPARDERLLPSGDEAGTPPGDRLFRPDILGLRAVAVLLVVLEHAKVTSLRGGYVGVDVFFVISGFVITGLLLRERSATGKTNLLAFYGRRARRIIPAAMLVIVITVIAERIFFGSSTVTAFAAAEARGASVFLANYCCNPTTTSSTRCRAPLTAYWSLAIEEQFYLVYPMLLVAAATIARRRSLRVKLGVLLGVTIAISFTWSVISSRVPVRCLPTFRLSRVLWELAVGGLLAVCGIWLKKLPLTLQRMTGSGSSLSSWRLSSSKAPGRLTDTPDMWQPCPWVRPL